MEAVYCNAYNTTLQWLQSPARQKYYFGKFN